MESPLDAVLAEVKPLADRFAAGDASLYLVGGIVRDLQLGVDIAELDFDLTTDARPAAIKKLVAPIADAVWDQGERFGTIGCLVRGRPYEITTHRADTYISDTRKPEVAFGDDIEGDLSRRDFTVNAMAISVFDGRLIDPFDGLAALEQKLLLTPIEATISFSDDPLRIMRAARFIARYELQPAVELRDAAVDLVERLDIVSAERVRDELDKLLQAVSPSSGFEFLREIGALQRLLPFVPAEGVGDLGTLLDSAPIDREVRRAIVFAASPGADLNAHLSELRYSNEEVRLLESILTGLNEVRSTKDWPDEAVRRLVDEVGYGTTSLLTRTASVVDPRATARFVEHFDRLDGSEDLALLEPALSGGEVMEALGIEPGPAVGDALAKLKERRLRDGPASKATEIDFLKM